MQALPLVLVVVLVIVAAAAVVFLRRRRHAATAARLAAASSPVPELSEDDIAWRIGLLDDRPLLLSEFFAGAENEAIEAAEQELGTPILPVLPKAPGAAPVPVTLAAAVGAQPAAPAPVAAAVTTAAVATAPRPVVREPGPSRRYRLWRDSATVVLGAILVVLLVTNLMPGLAVGPSLAGDEDPSSAAVAVVAPTPTSVDASSDVASAAPTDAPSGTPVATPTDAGQRLAVGRPDPRAHAEAHAQADPAPDAPARGAPGARSHPAADAAAHAPAHAEAHAEADPEAHARSRRLRPRSRCIVLRRSGRLTVTCTAAGSQNTNGTHHLHVALGRRQHRASGKTASPHTYADPGSYTVTLTVKNTGAPASTD